MEPIEVDDPGFPQVAAGAGQVHHAHEFSRGPLFGIIGNIGLGAGNLPLASPDTGKAQQETYLDWGFQMREIM